MTTAINWRDFIARQAQAVREPRIKAFYQSQMFDPQMLLEEVPLVAMDFETTGLDADEHEIISIGLVPFTLQRIYLRQTQEWFVRPRKSLTHDSVTIHRITHSQIQSAPDFSEVIGPLLEALSGRIAVVHFKYIERDFLYNAVKQRIGEQLMFPVIDTMELEDRCHRQAITTRLKQMIRGRKESVRLADSRDRYGLPRYQLHSAHIDALATAELLQAQIYHHFDSDVRLGDIWS